VSPLRQADQASPDRTAQRAFLLVLSEAEARLSVLGDTLYRLLAAAASAGG